MSIMIIISGVMLFIMWYAQDRSGRRQVWHPTFTGGMFGGGKPNPYIGKMCKVGAVLGVMMGLLTGGIVYLARIMP